MRDEHGRFLPGPDAARHQFTRRERRKGYVRLMRGGRAGELSDECIYAIYLRIVGYYRGRGKFHQRCGYDDRKHGL